jgi:hypothetical protein
MPLAEMTMAGRLRLLRGAQDAEVPRGERGRAGVGEPAHVEVVVLGMARVDRRHVDGHRTVDEDRQRRDASLVLEHANHVEQLLRAIDGERRHQQHLFARRGLVDDARELGLGSRRVQAVAIRRLDQKQVGFRHELGVAQDHSAPPAEIAREHERPPAGRQGHGRRAEDVTGSPEDDLESLPHREGRGVGMGLHERERSLRVGGGVERQRRRVLRGAVPVGELGVFLLEVRRIEQQHLQQVGGARRAVDGSAKAAPDQ